MKALPCWVGMDLSKRSDLAALVALFKEMILAEDGTRRPYYFVVCHCFVPEEGIELKEQRDAVPYREWARAGHITLTPGDCIEYAAIRDHLLEVWARRYQIREIDFDWYNAQMLVDDLKKRNMTCVEIPQQNKHVSPATMELKNLVLEQRMSHGGDPVLRWMVENVAVLVDHNGNERLTKKKSTARIDALSALVNALARASVAEMQQSVYEERGVIQV
jgi:phage terminase large subunit-like protein